MNLNKLFQVYGKIPRADNEFSSSAMAAIDRGPTFHLDVGSSRIVQQRVEVIVYSSVGVERSFLRTPEMRFWLTRRARLAAVGRVGLRGISTC